MTTVQYMGLAKQVYAELKRMIVENELQPGEKLLQEKLSAQLGVSRTPLLKALQMLECEYLVSSKPRRGLYVRRISIRELANVFECRCVLEGLAAKLACSLLTDKIVEEMYALFRPFNQFGFQDIDFEAYNRVDRQFHDTIMDLNTNDLLKRMDNLSGIHVLACQQGISRPPSETLPEHIEIIDALAERDGEKSELKMRQHLEKYRDVIKQQLY